MCCIVLTLKIDPDAAKKDPTLFYETAPRANVFRRDQHKVADLSAMKKIMRYNNWQHDPLALVWLPTIKSYFRAFLTRANRVTLVTRSPADSI